MAALPQESVARDDNTQAMELLPPDATRLFADNGLPLDIRGRPISATRRESLVVDAPKRLRDGGAVELKAAT